jgi:Ca2+:H+ antiporter
MPNSAVVSAPAVPPGSAGASRVFSRSDLTILGLAALASVLAGAAHYAAAPSVLRFVVSAAAIALLASVVGRCVERLGDRLGAGATGVLQSALGNLPELFIAFFALRAGLLSVVQAAIIGSILANLLLVLGAAFIVGGLKHGTQRFSAGPARTNVVLLALATAALVLPSFAAHTNSPATHHLTALSVAVAIVLLAVFALSLPASLRRQTGSGSDSDSSVGNAVRAIGHEDSTHHQGHWPIWLAVVLLAASGVIAGLVSDWFVDALQPAMESLHISQAFAGLVIVAIAGNAVENFVGIQLAARNQADYALSVIVNSPLQIALVLAPVLVLLSFFTATTLTLVFSPLLVICVVVSVVVTALIVNDGESNWLEGVILVALYAIIATMFWWG